MLGLFQQTPSYQGPGQPAAGCGGGLLGVLAGWLGGRTPAYQGEGQTAPTRMCWGLFPGTPAYQSPPTVTPATEPEPLPEPEPTEGPGAPCGPEPVTIVIRRGA